MSLRMTSREEKTLLDVRGRKSNSKGNCSKCSSFVDKLTKGFINDALGEIELQLISITEWR